MYLQYRVCQMMVTFHLCLHTKFCPVVLILFPYTHPYARSPFSSRPPLSIVLPRSTTKQHKFSAVSASLTHHEDAFKRHNYIILSYIISDDALSQNKSNGAKKNTVFDLFCLFVIASFGVFIGTTNCRCI